MPLAFASDLPGQTAFPGAVAGGSLLSYLLWILAIWFTGVLDSGFLVVGSMWWFTPSLLFAFGVAGIAVCSFMLSALCAVRLVFLGSLSREFFGPPYD